VTGEITRNIPKRFDLTAKNVIPAWEYINVDLYKKTWIPFLGIQSMMPIVNQILSEIALIIEETPPDLVADILEKGMVMAGGGSLIRGFDKLISERIGMPVWVTDTPLEAVVRGCAKVLEDDKLLGKVRVVGGLR